MLPTLFALCSLHRIIAYSNLTRSQTELDFSGTIQKLRDHQTPVMNEDGTMEEPYELMQDKEEISSVVSEIGAKGLVPFEYQHDLFNFMLFWYFFSSFLAQAFALLYYRKYREN